MPDFAPAEKLRAAAALLREARAGVSYGPPWVVADDRPDWVVSGDLRPWGAPMVADCGTDGEAAWIVLVSPELAEPLAALLEHAARLALEHPQDANFTGLPEFRFCTSCQDEETDCIQAIDRASAVAARILGEAP